MYKILINHPKRLPFSSNFFTRAFSSTTHFTVRSPYSNEPVYEAAYVPLQDAQALLKKSSDFQNEWKKTPLSSRLEIVEKVSQYFNTNFESIAKNLTLQMGKPITQSRNEIKGMLNRIAVMSSLAAKELEPEIIKTTETEFQQITREPHGLIFLICPWNYPLLTTINTLIAAVLAGNSVVIKPSPYTPYFGKVFQDAFESAGVTGLVSDCFVSLEDCQPLLLDPLINFVGFTGSVDSGRFVYEHVVNSRRNDFIDMALELGGKDGFYVAKDVKNVQEVAEALMDGAMYNAGQSCCAVERIFIHQDIHDDFLHYAVQFLSKYKLDDPLLETTTMAIAESDREIL